MRVVCRYSLFSGRRMESHAVCSVAEMADRKRIPCLCDAFSLVGNRLEVIGKRRNLRRFERAFRTLYWRGLLSIHLGSITEICAAVEVGFVWRALG